MNNVHKRLLIIFVFGLTAVVLFVFSGRETGSDPSLRRELPVASFTASASSDIAENTRISNAEFVISAETKVTIEQLLDAGWHRVARVLILQKKFVVPRQISTRLGTVLGDPDFFWSGRSDEESAQSYWFRNVHSTLPVETKWRILMGWPADDHSYMRWLLVAKEWLFRPITASDAAVTDICRGLVGQFYETMGLRNFTEVLLRAVGCMRVLPMLCLLGDDSRQNMIMAATLMNFGWSWVEIVALLDVPPAMNSVAAQWWLESGFPHRAWAVSRQNPEPFLVRIFEDAALAAAAESPGTTGLPFDKAFLQSARNNYRAWHTFALSEPSTLSASHSDLLNILIETLNVTLAADKSYSGRNVASNSAGRSLLSD